jgi:hypothetical protein
MVGSGDKRRYKEPHLMKKLLPFLIAALVIPSVALAKAPNPHKGTNHGKAKVQYILKGTLSAFSAFDSSTSANGSVTIAVTHANRHAQALKGMSLTFTGMVASSTKIVLEDGVTVITDGDRGIVKLRAPKAPKVTSGSDLAAMLTVLPLRQVIDQGSAS